MIPLVLRSVTATFFLMAGFVLIREYSPGRGAVAAIVAVFFVLPAVVVAYSLWDYRRGSPRRRGDTSRGRYW